MPVIAVSRTSGQFRPVVSTVALLRQLTEICSADPPSSVLDSLKALTVTFAADRFPITTVAEFHEAMLSIFILA